MATSRLALPLMTIFVILLWLAYLVTEVTLWPSFVIFIICTYLMVELNNRNALMRQYSRMVSCSYMAMMMMCPWLIRDPYIMGGQLCFIATISLLFSTYQNHSLTGRKLWAYAFFGISVVIWPPLILLLPIFWICEAFFLMSFSGKAFGASVFGLLLPLWILAPILLFTQRFDLVEKQVDMIMPGEKLMSIINDVSSLVIDALPLPLFELCIIVFVIILFLTGAIHFFRNSHTDKIQTRMYYQSFTLIAAVVVFFFTVVCLLPCQTLPGAYMLLAVFVVCTSPLIAHYITFTNTRLTNISVILLMIIVMSIDVYVCVMQNAQSIISLIQR